MVEMEESWQSTPEYRAKNDKDQLRRKGIHSPNEKRMIGVHTNAPYTCVYFSEGNNDKLIKFIDNLICERKDFHLTFPKQANK